MRYLVISDLHANWEALEAVEREAEGRYDHVLCCGDLVGYGADPNAVVAWVRTRRADVVRGNHDKACSGQEDLAWFNPVAQKAALWTQAALAQENLEYVRQLPRGPLLLENCELVHGSPSDEDEYVLADSEAGGVFAYLERPLTFFGHTHVQGGYVWRCTDAVQKAPRVSPRSERQVMELDPAFAYFLNPGSVGQPRDGDPRAAFALYDSDARMVTYRRVPYDVETTQRKIRAAGLPTMLAERLSKGR